MSELQMLRAENQALKKSLKSVLWMAAEYAKKAKIFAPFVVNKALDTAIFYGVEFPETMCYVNDPLLGVWSPEDQCFIPPEEFWQDRLERYESKLSQPHASTKENGENRKNKQKSKTN